MKNYLILLALLLSFSSFAHVEMKELAGTWSTSCIQTQIDGRQGFVIESYTFKEPGSYEMKRNWYKEAQCTSIVSSEDDKGTLKIGEAYTKNAFNPKGTHEAEFITDKGTEKGLMWISEDHSRLRVGRGNGKQPGSMLGLMIFTKGLTNIKL